MSERLPESSLIIQDTTNDGLLTLTVWRDITPQTELMKESGIEAMGTLRIYNNVSATLEREERVPLSHGAVYGPGPTEEEVVYWEKLINQFYADHN